MTIKERGILFSDPMVHALIYGSKTHTRRVVKRAMNDVTDAYRHPVLCPHGQPGDRLWVRENGWERPECTPKMMRDGADTWAPYYFDADGISAEESSEFKAWGFKRRPSIHMPHWASRITLEITGVRVERLQDISEADAFLEGIPRYANHHKESFFNQYTNPEKPRSQYLNAKDAFMSFWESINGPGSWAANPWVWVITFKRLKP